MIAKSLAMFALACAVFSAPARAQSPQDKVAAFRQMLAQNQAKRRTYTWLETTHMAYDGTIKMTKVSDCQYQGSNPRPTCTEMSLQQAPPPSGFLRRRIAERKGEELRAYMDTVKTLVASYVPVNGELVRKAYESGNVLMSQDPSTGTDKLIVTNYKQMGDTITIVYRASTKAIVSVALSTYVGQASAPVTANITFATLPSGVFYAYQKTLNVRQKGVTITVTATDFSELIQQ